MNFDEEFEKKFQIDYLKQYYIENIESSAITGIDKINALKFNLHLSLYLDIINRKVMNSTYNFIPYKEVLISKGRNKNPRIISIPCIRDRLVLSIMKDILNDVFGDNISREFIKKKIEKVNEAFKSNSYNCYIKLDMKNFYGSLNHEVLLETIKNIVKNERFIYLVDKAIKGKTISSHERKDNVETSMLGVPQGLPISNILADIYMAEFDKFHLSSTKYKYFRYVDDIIIFCDEKDSESIFNSIFSELEKVLKLQPHPLDESNKSKTCIGKIESTFSYLGYEFKGDSITVREFSIKRYEKALEKIFVDYTNKKIDKAVFLWLLNSKITGVKFENRLYGWIAYFSQINDVKILCHIDNLVKKFFKRFKINNKDMKIKSIRRAFYEITKNLNETKYIPNFDNMDSIQIKKILDELRIKYTEENYIQVFKKFIKRTLKDQEKDTKQY